MKLPLHILILALCTVCAYGCGDDSSTTPTPLPNSDAGSTSDASDDVQGDSSPDVTPDADTGDEPDADAGDEPDADAGDEPDADAGDEPDADAGDEPDADTGDEPDTDTGDEPDADTGDDADAFVDSTAPTVEITSGTAALDDGSYILEGSASDDVALTALRYRINDAAPVDIALVEPFRVELDLGESPSTIEVIAEDEAGNIGSDSIAVTIPTGDSIVPSFTVSTNPTQRQPVTFDASATQGPDGEDLTYTWDFGDGQTRTSLAMATTGILYDQPGPYTVTLVVESAGGQTATTSRDITVTAPVSLGTATVHGRVYDAQTFPLGGVRVLDENGDERTRTDEEGRYTVDVERGFPVALRLVREEYTQQVVRVEIDADTDTLETSSTLKRRAQPVYLEDAAEGGVVRNAENVQVDFPAGALVDEETGEPVEGVITVVATPVDMSAQGENAAFPGSFDGLAESGDVELIASYGVVEVELSQDGRPVQIAPGESVTLDIPVRGALQGSEVPLWSLSEETGLWVQEGVGTIVSRNGQLVMEARVSHFSWWNSDLIATDLYKPVGTYFKNIDGTPYVPPVSARIPMVTVDARALPAVRTRQGLPVPQGTSYIENAIIVSTTTQTDVEFVFVESAPDSDEILRILYGFEVVEYVDGLADIDIFVREVGSDDLPTGELPPLATPDNATFSDRTEAYWAYVDLEEGNSVQIEARASGRATVLVRDVRGAVISENALVSGRERAFIFTAPRTGRYFIQVRSDGQPVGNLTIGGDVTEPQRIYPCTSIDSTLDDTNQRSFILHGNDFALAYATLQNTGLSTWSIDLLAPDGLRIASLSSSAFSDAAHGTFEPTPLDASTGYILRVQGSPGDSSDFTLVTGCPTQEAEVFDLDEAQSTIAFLGEDEENPTQGNIHVYDIPIRSQQRLVVRLQPVVPAFADQPTTFLTGVLAKAIPMLSVDGVGTEINTLGTEEGTFLRTMTTPFFEGVRNLRFYVALPEGASGHYHILVEQDDLFPERVERVRVGDPTVCPDADVQNLLLGFQRLSEGGTLSLCPTPAGSIRHEYNTNNGLPGAYNIEGDAATRSEIGVDLYRDITLVLQPNADHSDVVWEGFSLRSYNPNSVADLRTRADVTIRDVILENVSTPGNFSQGIGITARSNTEHTMTLENIIMRGDFQIGVRIESGLNLAMDNVEMVVRRGHGVLFENTNATSSLHIERSTIDAYDDAIGVRFNTQGDFTMTDSTVRMNNAASRFARALDLNAPAALDTDRSLIVTGNTLDTNNATSSSGIYIALLDDVDQIHIRANTFTALNPTANVSFGVTVDVSGVAAFNDFLLENNVFVLHTRPVVIELPTSAEPLRMLHNSIYGRATGGPLVEFSGTEGRVEIVNNAFAFDEDSTSPSVEVAAPITGVARKNVHFNVADPTPLYAPRDNFTVTEDLGLLDPLWDLVTLYPGALSPLIDAGNASSTSTDIDGNTRPQGAAPDIGAFEVR